MKDYDFEIKVDYADDREKIIVGLVNSGYTVSIYKQKSGMISHDYYLRVKKNENQDLL